MKNGASSSSKGNNGCFLCDGPHFARNCPRKERLNALMASEGNNEEGTKSLPKICLGYLQLAAMVIYTNQVADNFGIDNVGEDDAASIEYEDITYGVDSPIIPIVDRSNIQHSWFDECLICKENHSCWNIH